jgi:hypothetical protein
MAGIFSDDIATFVRQITSTKGRVYSDAICLKAKNSLKTSS